MFNEDTPANISISDSIEDKKNSIFIYRFYTNTTDANEESSPLELEPTQKEKPETQENIQNQQKRIK